MKKVLILSLFSMFCFSGPICNAVAAGAAGQIVVADVPEEINTRIRTCLHTLQEIDLQAQRSSAYTPGAFANCEAILNAPGQST